MQGKIGIILEYHYMSINFSKIAKIMHGFIQEPSIRQKNPGLPIKCFKILYEEQHQVIS